MAIEGVDGSGKTTQAKMLGTVLENSNYSVKYVKTLFIILDIIPFSRNIEKTFSPRKVNVSKSSKKNFSIISRVIIQFWGYIYAVVTYVYLKIHYMNTIVVCDRYFFQFFHDLFNEKSKLAIKLFPKPDYTFFLNGDVDHFYSRMDDEFDCSVNKTYYEEAIIFYREISDEYGFIEIDASKSKKEINDDICRYLMKQLEAN